jgi:hypothetical protein
MIEESRLIFLQEREEQELETAYRSVSNARKQWHLAIASGYSRLISEIEHGTAGRRAHTG